MIEAVALDGFIAQLPLDLVLNTGPDAGAYLATAVRHQEGPTS